MTEGTDVSGLMSETMAFRLEISDFSTFYERTYDTAYRTALGIIREPALAADVTQEAYVAAYRHRDRYRGEAPSSAWLHRIVVNQALSALRRRRATHRCATSRRRWHRIMPVGSSHGWPSSRRSRSCRPVSVLP